MAQFAAQGSEEDEQHRFMPRNWRAVLQAKEAVLQASLRVEEDGDDAGFNAAVGAYEDAQFDAAVEAYAPALPAALCEGARGALDHEGFVREIRVTEGGNADGAAWLVD